MAGVAAVFILGKVLQTVSAVLFLGIAGVVVFAAFKLWQWGQDMDKKYPEK